MEKEHKTDATLVGIDSNRKVQTDLPFKSKFEYEKLAMTIESIDGNGKVSEENQIILNLYASGTIDYETAVSVIKRSFAK